MVAHRQSAFTLIELLACIGIVMVLIGLLLPSIARVRESARETQSMTQLRTIGQAVATYTTSQRDWYPVGEAGRFYPASFGGGTSISFGNHFEFGRNLPVLLRNVAPWEEYYGVWFSPGLQHPSPGQNSANRFSYRYSHSFLARPELWRIGAIGDQRMLNGVRDSEVLFPSVKVMAWDGAMAYLLRPQLLGIGDMLSNRTPMLFADNHVDRRFPAEASAAVTNVMNPRMGENMQPLHNTPLGVRGRDF